MDIQELQQQWQKSFDESVASINNMITPCSYDYEYKSAFRQLAQWMLETPYSPYDFMPNGFKDFRSNPYTTDGALSILHHALLDDGEVSFVKLIHEGKVERVFMIFMWHKEDCFHEYCMKENQSLINSFIEGRESLTRIMTDMREKNPDKTFNHKPLVSKGDFIFEAHREPLQFIADVEEYQLQLKKSREESELWIKQIRNRKP